MSTSDNGPLVTVAIPTYNRADGYLREALESALAQSYPRIEILVSDNSSTDGTEKLVRSYHDGRTRYVRHQRNIGANNNYNFCVHEARGDYFLLLHDDDSIDHDFIDICIRALGPEGDVGIIRTGTRIVNDHGRVIREAPNLGAAHTIEEFLEDWFSGRSELYFCSTLFNTAYLRHIGGFHSRTDLLQDVSTMIQLVAHHGIQNVEDVKASFRRHQNNKGSLAAIEEWCKDSLYVLDQISRYVPEDRELRKRGAFFLCRKCYRQISNISSLLSRLKACMIVLNYFRPDCSPIRFLVSTNLKPLISHVRGSR